MELWDVYDINRSRTGRLHPRPEPMPEGDYHTVIHVCLFNHAGQMLIQQRQTFKEGWPNLWDVTVGGSALAGETSRQAAARELEEEVGIRLSFENSRPRMTINFSCGFDDWYVAEAEADPASLQLQYEEVQAARWATEQEIMEMLEDGRFIPYRPELIRLIFAMRHSSGGLRATE